MIAWRGAGFLTFFVIMAAFMAVALGFDGPTKGELWPWGAAAALSGLIVLPLGYALNRRRGEGQTHDFMFIPMQYWGGLLLLGGLGLLGAHLIVGATDGSSGGAASANPCDEVGSIIAACPNIGAASGMLVGMCAQSPEAAQLECLGCLRSSSDPCRSGECDACSFRPTR